MADMSINNDVNYDSDKDKDNAAMAGSNAASALMSSFFPSPPSYHTHFSDSSLLLARRLVSSSSLFSLSSYRQEYTTSSSTWLERQAGILREIGVAQDELERVRGEGVDLVSLVQVPDVELIEEDGHWMSFGQAWPIHEALPTLEEMGVKQLYRTPVTFEGRRQALHSLLRTLLHTYLRLLTILTHGPPSLVAEQQQQQQQHPAVNIKTQADSAIEHLRLAAINIHHLCNEWRPIQARETMKLLMREQVRKRREKVLEMRRVSEGIKGRLEGLRTRVSKEAEGDNVVGQMHKMEIEQEQLLDDVKSPLIDGGVVQRASRAADAVDDAKTATQRRMLAALDELGS